MQALVVTCIFLVVKCFQFLNSVFLNDLFSSSAGNHALVAISTFVFIFFLSQYLVVRYIPKAVKGLVIIIVLWIIIMSLADFFWMMTCLSGLFLLALISSESKVMGKLVETKKIPRFLLLVVSLLPLLLSLVIPGTSSVGSIGLYIAMTIFAYVISYFEASIYHAPFVQNRGSVPMTLGFIFMAASMLVKYLITFNENVPQNVSLAFILLFYAGGALIVYMSLKQKLERVS